LHGIENSLTIPHNFYADNTGISLTSKIVADFRTLKKLPITKKILDISFLYV